MAWLLMLLPVSVAVGGEIWLRHSRQQYPGPNLDTLPWEDR